MSSVLPSYPNSINAQNVQIWNNAAFDDTGEDAVADEPPNNPAYLLPLQAISVNRCRSSDKENRSFPKSPGLSALKPSGSFPLTSYPGKAPGKVTFRLEGDRADEEDREIDKEIESIENEIGRLKSRLEVLQIKKAERDSRVAGDGRRGRVVPARFMDPNQRPCKKRDASPAQRKAEETPGSAKGRKRAVSLGPSEIGSVLRKLPESMPPSRTPGASARKTRYSLAVGASTTSVCTNKAVELTPAARSGKSLEGKRRDLNLGPAEIAGTSRQTSNLCKLQNSIIVERVESTRSQSVSPKPKKPAADSRRGVATVGSKNPVKKEEEIHALEPKTLFQDGNDQEEAQNKPVAVPKRSQPPKNPRSRIVPSRYSLIDTRFCPESKRRKWSLPEKEEKESGVKESAKRSRVSLPVTGDQGKKPREAEAETVVETGFSKGSSVTASAEVSTPPLVSPAGGLPRIRISRGDVSETPRDSGPAKKVAELIGRITHFGHRIAGGDPQPADDCFQSMEFKDVDEAPEPVCEEQVP